MARPLSMAARLIAAQIGEALRCPTCSKLTTVANTAGHGQRFAGERVSPATHCACPGGPAYVAPAPAPCTGRAEITEAGRAALYESTFTNYDGRALDEEG